MVTGKAAKLLITILHIWNESCHDIAFLDHRGRSHKDQSRSLGRIAGRETSTVKLRISKFMRQDERKERRTKTLSHSRTTWSRN